MLEIRFRPETVDVVVLHLGASQAMARIPGDGEGPLLVLRLLRPGDAIPVALVPRPGESGSLQYVMEATDLYRPGEWRAQVVNEGDASRPARLHVEDRMVTPWKRLSAPFHGDPRGPRVSAGVRGKARKSAEVRGGARRCAEGRRGERRARALRSDPPARGSWRCRPSALQAPREEKSHRA